MEEVVDASPGTDHASSMAALLEAELVQDDTLHRLTSLSASKKLRAKARARQLTLEEMQERAKHVDVPGYKPAPAGCGEHAEAGRDLAVGIYAGWYALIWLTKSDVLEAVRNVAHDTQVASLTAALLQRQPAQALLEGVMHGAAVEAFLTHVFLHADVFDAGTVALLNRMRASSGRVLPTVNALVTLRPRRCDGGHDAVPRDLLRVPLYVDHQAARTVLRAMRVGDKLEDAGAMGWFTRGVGGELTPATAFGTTFRPIAADYDDAEKYADPYVALAPVVAPVLDGSMATRPYEALAVLLALDAGGSGGGIAGPEADAARVAAFAALIDAPRYAGWQLHLREQTWLLTKLQTALRFPSSAAAAAASAAATTAPSSTVAFENQFFRTLEVGSGFVAKAASAAWVYITRVAEARMPALLLPLAVVADVCACCPAVEQVALWRFFVELWPATAAAVVGARKPRRHGTSASKQQVGRVGLPGFVDPCPDVEILQGHVREACLQLPTKFAVAAACLPSKLCATASRVALSTILTKPIAPRDSRVELWYTVGVGADTKMHA